ncbi:MAG: LuxR C-terminal-related transcriptional regulator [Caldilineales bacterium]|nr:LuxR C-terminal-related transcriptional regulator [Caldilineales bacterium]MDW8317134.1 LuxR C-terminal-related transcriptional regulator [Anaerolineae bacterium]
MLATKLSRPRLAAPLVLRPRLLARLTTGLDQGLLLISAPAGYGKNTVVNQWLDTVPLPWAWISLDEHDSHLATFLAYVLAALRSVYPKAAPTLEALLRAPALPAPPVLADALLSDLAALPGPLLLALDDYHAIQSLDVHAVMQRVVQHRPAHVRLALTTRADPPLALERLRGRRQLCELRSADLRFTAEEAAELLRQELGATPAEEITGLLAKSTEGWAVGLHLMALTLRGQDDPVAFARKVAQSGHQLMLDYLLAEVLQGLSDDQRSVLLQTSVLDRLCAPLVDAIQDPDQPLLPGAALVAELRRANLFLTPLDDEGTWFSYHQIFRHLLLNWLRRGYSQAAIRAMHARASAWFAKENLLDEAIAHALQANDPQLAAGLVECYIHEALNREDWRQLERWIGLLPAEMLRRPRLLLAQAWLSFIRYQFPAVKTLVEAAEAALAEETAQGLGQADKALRGEIAALRATLAYASNKPADVVRWASEGMRLLRPEMRYAMGLAIFFYITGLQATGQVAEAIEVASQQLAIHGQDPVVALRLQLALCNIYYETADLSVLQGAAALYEQMAQRAGLGLSVGWAIYIRSWLHYQRNELSAAEEGFRRLEAIVSHGRATVDCFTGLALTLLAQGRLDEAQAVAAALQTRLVERGMLALAPLAESLQQRALLASDPAAALERGYRAPAPPLSIEFWEQPALTQVRTLLASGAAEDLALAETLLAERRRQAATRHSRRTLIEIEGLQALVSLARGDEMAALAALRQAVELAAPGGAVRLLADCGPGLAGLLAKLATDGVAVAYVRQVLAALGKAPSPVAEPPSAARPPVRHALPPPARTITHEGIRETLTNRELDVLVLLAQRLSDKEIAERLVLAPVTVKKHTLHIYRKLGVNNRRAAAEAARRLGLV